MVRIGLALLLLAGVGVGVFFLARQTPPPLTLLAVGTLPGDTTQLDLKDSPTYYRQWNFRLNIKNNLDRGVRLAVRLEQRRGEFEVKLRGETSILPAGSARPTLIIKPPLDVGPFSGKLTVYSEDTDWTHVITLTGNVIEKAREGRWLRLRPAGVDLGEVKPGELRPFIAALSNLGTQNLVISEWRVLNEKAVRLQGLAGGELIVPGAELQMSGSVRVPLDAVGRWYERIQIVSDADNGEVHEFRVGGTIVPDYTTVPVRLRLGTVYPGLQREVEVTIRGREGTRPFRVTQARLGRYFTAIRLGAAEAAMEQLVVLKVARQAPIGKLAPGALTLRFTVEPPGTTVALPVEMSVQSTVYPEPALLVWQKVRVKDAGGVRGEIRLNSYRRFKVTSARSRNGSFVLEVRQAQGLAPRILVRLPEGILPNFYSDVILIETDDKDTPRLEVPARIEIVP